MMLLGNHLWRSDAAQNDMWAMPPGPRRAVASAIAGVPPGPEAQLQDAVFWADGQPAWQAVLAVDQGAPAVRKGHKRTASCAEDVKLKTQNFWISIRRIRLFSMV